MDMAEGVDADAIEGGTTIGVRAMGGDMDMAMVETMDTALGGTDIPAIDKQLRWRDSLTNMSGTFM